MCKESNKKYKLICKVQYTLNCLMKRFSRTYSDRKTNKIKIYLIDKINNNFSVNAVSTKSK